MLGLPRLRNDPPLLESPALCGEDEEGMLLTLFASFGAGNVL